jgi:hypothetical protein
MAEKNGPEPPPAKPPEKLPEPLEEASGFYETATRLYAWIRSRWGRVAAVIAVCMLVALLLWWKWPDIGHLTEAVAAYRAALEERTRERVPLDWAMTQNNLGNALLRLGERGRDSGQLCNALQVHVDAWRIYQEAAPYYASIAKDGAQKDLRAMAKQYMPSSCATWLADNAEVLKEMGVSVHE